MLAAFNKAHGQQPQKKLELKGALGVGFFEKKLDFQVGPSLGLGAGYNISDLLQLNLTFSYNPTQQRISTATEKVTAEYSVYIYVIGLQFSPRKPLLWILSPFVELGAGGIIIDPKAVSFDIGAGNIMQFEAPVDHHISGNLGGGLTASLSQRFQLEFAYRHSLYSLNLDDGSNRETIMAQNKFVGLSLSTSF